MKRQILKVTVKNGVGVTVKYQGERDRKGTQHEVTEKIKAEPESGFANSVMRMGGYLVKCSSLGYAEHALDQDKLSDQIATADKPTVIKSVLAYLAKSLRVDSVQLTWSDAEVSSVAISGTFTNHVGDSNKLVGPAIQLDQKVYGFESRLRKDINELLESTESYLKGKYTQIVIDEEEEPTETEASNDEDEEEVLQPVLRKVAN